MAGTVFGLVLDLVPLLRSALRSHTRLAAENVCLRKQLALYSERTTQPRRADNATRLTWVRLADCIEWRPLRTVVQPDTLGR